MRFATKIFLAVLLPALGLTLGISAALYTFLATSTRAQYLAHYQSVTKQVAATLSQLEATTDVLMAATVRVLADRVKMEGLPEDGALKKLRTELGITHLYILNKDGFFIRATSEDPSLLPNAYTYCSLYRDMFAQGAVFHPTGLMPGIPGLIPFKFLFLPSDDRQYLMEVGVRADFIGQTLTQTLSADPDLISLALYAPNGANLGEFFSDGHYSYERSLSPSASFGTKTLLSSGKLQLTERVAASNKDCCSCRQRGLVDGGDFHYYLRTIVSTRALDGAIRRLSFITILLAGIGLLLSLVASLWLSRRLVARIELINEQAQVIMRTGDLSRRLNLHDADEVGRLSAQIDEMLSALQVKQRELIQHEKTIGAIEATRRVVHDIRSPLAAFDTLLKVSTDIPEEQRVLLRTAVARVREIANALLEQTQPATASTEAMSTAVLPTTEAVLALVEASVMEKQQQYRGQTGVAIQFPCSERAFPLFVRVHAQLFLRALSNLLDNAVEALEQTGQVSIIVEESDGQVKIEVSDTGRGIPAELLPALMEKGQTFGKPGGSGLGLFAAREAITAWGGTLSITSQVGRGTTVTVMLPIAPPPAWFIAEIRVPADATVVIVDDDASIHEVWRTRFSAIAHAANSFKLIHFSTAEELRAFCTSRPTGAAPTIILMDYELRDSSSNGLDGIRALGLAASSILVTSHADEPAVRERCVALGVRLLSKSAAPLVPIRLG